MTLAAYGQYAPFMPGLWERYRENIVATLADVEVRGAAEGEPSRKNPEMTHREERNPESRGGGEPSQKNPEMSHREEQNPESRGGGEPSRRIGESATVDGVEQIVAERDGVLVGAVLLYPAGGVIVTSGGTPLRWPEVRLLAVSPDARGAGVGQALMDECVRRARRAGANALTLHTTDMMDVAMRLYERMGFARAPELDFRPAPQVTVKGYRLELDVKRAGSGR